MTSRPICNLIGLQTGTYVQVRVQILIDIISALRARGSGYGTGVATRYTRVITGDYTSVSSQLRESPDSFLLYHSAALSPDNFADFHH